MAYIGKEPIVGNFQKCDAISVVNGQAAYTLQVSSTNVIPESANHMLVSLNGILQAPITSFTVSGSTLTFASNLATGDVIDFVILLGNVLDLGTPSDGTVTNAKLAQDIISGETELASEPADTDEFLVSDAGVLKRIDYSHIKGGGKILQVVNATDSTSRNSSSTSFVTASNTLTVDITPSSTSNKVFVICQSTGYTAAGQMPVIITYLDSPSSTSSLTYQIYGRTSGAGEYKSVYTIYRDSTNLAGGTQGFVELGANASNQNFYLQNDSKIGSITAYEIAG